MATVVVAAGVDAAADVQIDFTQVMQLVHVLVALGDGLGNRDGPGIRQGAKIASGAGNHVAEQSNVGTAKARRSCGMPERGQLLAADPGQQQVLVVADPGFAGGKLVGQFCRLLELLGVGVARRLAQTLERQGHDAQARIFVCGHVLLQPAGIVELLGGRGILLVGQALRAPRLLREQRRRHKRGAHPVEFGLGDGVRSAVLCQYLLVLGFHFVSEALALGLDQNFDARFVDVVSAAPAVVDPHQGLEVVQDLMPGQERADGAGNHRGASHAAAHQHLEAYLALLIAQHLQADIVPGGGGPVFVGAGHRYLELARQKGKLWV